MRKQLPPRDLQWIDAQGRPTEIFFEYIKNLEGRSLGQPVSITAPADTEVMIYNGTDAIWEPGAN